MLLFHVFVLSSLKIQAISLSIVATIYLPLQDTESVYEKLQFFDTKYSKAISSYGTVLHPPPFNAKDHPTVEKSWEFTASSSQIAIIEEAIGDPSIEYRQRPSDVSINTSGVVNYDKDENMYIGVETKAVWCFEKNKSSKYRCITSFKVDANDQILKRTPNNNFRYCDADSSSLLLGPKTAMWVLGRGFSNCISEVSDVRVTDGGQLEVTASGGLFDKETMLGTWKLVVDPENDYIVRSAKFFLPSKSSDTSPFFSMSNANIKESDQAFYPSESEYQISSYGKSKFAIKNVSLKANDDLLDDALNITNDSDKPRTITIDERVRPAEIRVNDD